MSTDKQITANRENSQHSTGPVTLEGVANSSRNNFRHGLIGKFHITQDEDPTEFEQLRSELFAEYHPESATEIILVDKMAQSKWLTDRAVRYQSYAIDYKPCNEEERRIALLMRYQTVHEKSFYKALNELTKLRKQRQQEEIGFERKKTAEAADRRKADEHEVRLRLLEIQEDQAELELERKQKAMQRAAKPAQTPELDEATLLEFIRQQTAMLVDENDPENTGEVNPNFDR